MAIDNIPVWSFQVDWETEVIETLEFFTNILTSRSGAEQRRSNRNTPRRYIEFDITAEGAERANIDNFIRKHGGKEIYLPIWFDQYITTENANSGTQNVYVPVEGRKVMLVEDDVVFITENNPLKFELGEIDYFEDEFIKLKHDLDYTWPAGTKVYKAVKAKLVEQPSFTGLSQEVDQGTVRFMIREANPFEFTNDDTVPNRRREAQGLVTQGRVTRSTAAGASLFLEEEEEYVETKSNGFYVTHSFHDTSDPTGRTEEQFMFAAAMLAAHDYLKDELDEESYYAAQYYLDLGLTVLDAIGDGEEATPIVRAPISSDSEILNLPHYRFAARSNAPIGNVNLTAEITAVDNVLMLEDALGKGDVAEKIWKIYPFDAELHYPRPWSRAFNIEAPTVDVSFNIEFGDWTETDAGIEIPLPIGSPDDVDDWNVVYAYNSGAVIDIGNAFNLLPAISRSRESTSTYSGDISHWSERALTRAIALDERDGMATYWTQMRLQYRKTDLKGRRVNDQRWIFEPMPLAPAIPSIAEIPDGIFCYSDHIEADTPSGVAASDASWSGYNFITRDTTTGDWLATVPEGEVNARLQLGRIFPEQWRQAESYQYADQYLYVQLSCSRKPVLANGDYFLVWVSSKDTDEEEDRWFADIGSKVAFVATTLVSGTVIDFLIPITDFKRRSYNETTGVSEWGDTLTAGQILKSFGISAEFTLGYDMRIRSMRLLSGVNAAWVSANLAAAKKGYPMAFAPGVAPSLINLAMDQQRFLGENFSPLHGYQFADFWKIAETEANAIFSGLTPADLPIPNRTTNAIEYPITANTAGAVAKTPAALLMEQQLRFLEHAQDEYDDDGGDLGPFAHTYTMNTYDRFMFTDTAHSKWVYENVRPYTQWGGFQYRIAESLAQTIELVGATATYADSRALAVTLLTGFVSWLNVAWPDLTGTWAGFDGVRVFSGDEADYAHRFTGDENPFIEVYSE